MEHDNHGKTRQHDEAWYRRHNATALWHPMARPAELALRPPAIIVRGEGCHVWDIDGHRLLDGVGGLWTSNLGHSNTAVKQAMVRQLDQLPYYNVFNGVTHDRAIELSTRLVGLMAEDDVRYMFFSNGGSDAVETALKLARQYWRLQGKAGRSKFISMRQGYHGVHFGGMSVNGCAAFRSHYEPLMPGCFHIDPPWLQPGADLNDPALARQAAELLEREILFQGAESVAAFIAEPVQGAGGVYVPPEDFWQLARAVCDRHGVLLIADEVVTGFGRTGELFGTRLWNVKADLWCFAKGITSGYIPLGATAVGKRVAEVFLERDATVSHGYTYSAHPVAAAAALATLDEIERLDVVGNVRQQGALMQQRLREFWSRFEEVSDVRGIGLMAAVELGGSARDGAALANAVRQSAYHHGLMVRASGGNLILSPPLTISAAEVDTLCTVLADSLEQVLAG